MKKTGFTLVELIIAVSILTIGLVMVMRSFFTAQDAVRVTQEKLAAMKILQSKANELELKVYRQKGYLPQDIQKELFLGVRKAVYTLKTLNLKRNVVKENLDPTAAKKKEDPCGEVELRLSWQDNGRNNNESLIIYFENKEK